MAYQDFLSEFAKVQGLDSVEALLNEHADRYAFQIQSRERGKKLIELLRSQLDIDVRNRRILDIGCAYGSIAIEMAHLGAKVVGIDVNDKWLKLAEANAKNEIEIELLNCDASSRRALSELQRKGPFDLIILNDVFEHIYDTAGLLSNMKALLADQGRIFFKVPNGMATRSVLAEGHKKVFGISLLAPDYWHLFVDAPFHIYYRRWEYFEGLFRLYNLPVLKSVDKNHDSDIERTHRRIMNDVRRIRRHLKVDNFETPKHYGFVKKACLYYFEEVEKDLAELEWQLLHHKYCVTFWEGILGASRQS